MFTANVTPRLKLMKPLDSDQYETQDYADSFTIIDNNPGVALVDSYAGLATLASSNGYGTAQNGLLAYDRHNNAMWRYLNTSGSGSWVRANSVGLLKQVTQSVNVTTSTVNSPGILVLTSGVITVPGVRALAINVDFNGDNTSGANALGVLQLLDGTTTLKTQVLRLGAPVANNGSDHSFTYYLSNPVPESQHEFKLYMRSASGSSANGGGGTTVARYTTLTVSEV